MAQHFDGFIVGWWAMWTYETYTRELSILEFSRDISFLIIACSFSCSSHSFKELDESKTRAKHKDHSASKIVAGYMINRNRCVGVFLTPLLLNANSFF